jgi:hypothetical protein
MSISRTLFLLSFSFYKDIIVLQIKLTLLRKTLVKLPRLQYNFYASTEHMFGVMEVNVMFSRSNKNFISLGTPDIDTIIIDGITYYNSDYIDKSS